MIQNFRKSIGGFNREDVVQYIEFINNRHAVQVNQLKAELQTVRDELAASQANADLQGALESALAERDALQEQLTAAQAELIAVKDEAAAGAQILQELSAAQSEAAASEKLQEELAAAQSELSAVKKQLEQTLAELEAKSSAYAEQELEAYRRAERFERMAIERIAQMYAQANAALEQATAGSEDTAVQIGQMADSVSEQLNEMQAVLEKSKQTIQGAADAMKAIRPIEPVC